MPFKINSKTGKNKKINFSSYMVYIIFLVVMLIFALWLGGKFFSPSNILNITRQTAMISVMAVAMTLIIAMGHIDLSIGAIVALSALISGLVLRETNSIFLSLIASLGMGALVGACNGLFVVKLKIPAFLATLGVSSIIRGIAMWSTNTSAVPIFNKTFNHVFGNGTFLGIPILFLWTIAALLIGSFVLNKTAFGKKVLAIGGNSVAAKYTGVNVARTTTAVFVIMGIVAAFAGNLYAGKMQAARYTFGEGVEMSVIAAVILGGTSMAGGTGTIIGAVVGSLLIGMINNGLIIGGLEVAQQIIVQGIIIIIAVALGNIGKRKRG